MEEQAPQVAAEDAAALARFGGLTMPPERLERFARDLAGARQLVADLETVSTEGRAAVPAPFEAAWPVRESGR